MDAIALRYSDWESSCDKNALYNPSQIEDDPIDAAWRQILTRQTLRPPEIHIRWVGKWIPIVTKGSEVAGVAAVSSRAPETESVERLFSEQAEKWQRETGHLSSPTQRMMHPSYQAILGMGREHEREIVTLLIRDLQQSGRSWFGALSYITKENPIGRNDAGKMDKMVGAWVRWGRDKGLL